MATYKLRIPISEQKIRELKVNDIVYVSGTVVTVRDQAHKRALEWSKKGKLLPVDLEGLVVFHCGPVMSKRDGKWVAVAAGPTTSMRMDMFEGEFIRAFKPRIIVGKGGMGERTTEAMAKEGAVYCAYTGGAAVFAAKSIKFTKGVKWLDLGMPEAMWIFQVEMFGPLVVGIDSHRKNLFANVAEKVEANKHLIYDKYEL
jgi:fumarate hydratase subunit beta